MMQEYNNIMQDPPEEPSWWVVFKLCMICLVTAAILSALTSCTTTKFVEVERVHDVYHNTTDTIRDSIYHDVVHNIYVKGDTVHHDRTEYVYKWKYISIHDTLNVRDTIPTTVMVDKYIEKELSWWQEMLMTFGCISCVLFIIVVISFIRYNV